MTTSDEIPKDVTRFLLDYVDSVELLRVLLLLHANPKRAWRIAEITQELRSADSSIVKRLEDLYTRKVLIQVPDQKDVHSYNPASEEISSVIDQLEKVNQSKPYRIIEIIYSRPSSALTAFAEAFKLKGGK